MYLYSKDFSTRGNRESKANEDAYVVVDKGSAAEQHYLAQGYAPNADYDALHAEVEGNEDALAEATEAAEQKLQMEHAQRVAAEAKALSTGTGVMPAEPNDQSRQSPNTESADGKIVKDAVGAKETGAADSKEAVTAKVAGDAKEASKEAPKK